MAYNINMKKSQFLILVFSLVLFSCDLFDTGNLPEELPGNFWAVNIKTNIPYRVDAELLYTGTHCTVWAEKGSGITAANAKTIADEYDDNIYQKMIDAFNFSSSISFYGTTFSNTMAFADWLGDGNGKLCILLLDIRDTYQEGVDESYVAGYFYSADLLSGYLNSNLRDIIYIDTEPGFRKKPEEAKRTLAHEMQHLMNFVSSIAYRLNGNLITQMDTWIDEGLSSAAEYIYSDQHSTDRIQWFKNNGVLNPSNVKIMSGLIDKGNNFFVWGNRVGNNANQSIYANLDDYATVYLFFQWLRLQSGGTNDIYKSIISSTSSNYMAVVNSISAYSDWDTLLKTWLAANYINASSGAYGYLNDAAFSGMKAPTAPTGETSLNLYPGEGVYSIANTQPAISGQGANIKNVYLTTTANPNHTAGSTLLTYNKNTVLSGAAEKGVTTGVAAVSVMSSASLQDAPMQNAPAFSGPFPISAGDLLRRMGAENAQPLTFEFSINGNDGD